MNKKGVTLVELLIYIVLFSIVAVLIGSQMKSMVTGYSGGKQISRLQSNSRDLMAVISRDIRNTGFKRYLLPQAGGQLQDVIVGGAYYTDSSSFIHKEGNPGDTLVVKKISIDDKGEYVSTDSVVYYLSGTTLKRYDWTSTVDIASNVYALQFQYGIFSVDSLLLNQEPAISADWSYNGTSGWAWFSNTTLNVATAASGTITCTRQLSISSEENVWVIFRIVLSGDFPANLDSLKWIIKTSGGTELNSERFNVADTLMRIKMPLVAENNARIALKYWSNGSGTLRIAGVQVRRADIGQYIWNDNPPSSSKKAVKAIRVYALVRSDKKGQVVTNTPLLVANVLISRSGQYSWRLYSEAIETLNNGRF